MSSSPTELLDVVAWHDGSSWSSVIGNRMLLPLDECLEDWQMFTEMIGHDFDLENWWHQGWFPFASDGGGNRVCVDTAGTGGGTPGQVLIYWHADADRQVIAESLEDWFRQTLVAYERTDAPRGADGTPDDPFAVLRTFDAGPDAAKPVW